MNILLAALFFPILGGLGYLGFRLIQESARAKALSVSLAEQTARAATLEAEVQRLSPYSAIPDAEAHAASIVQAAQQQADGIAAQYQKYMAEVTQWANQTFDSITAQAAQITQAAKQQEQEALKNKVAYESTAQAIRNTIEGYGDQYIIPSRNLLDDLAEEFGFAEAGVELKKARAHTREMVKQKTAAACDYVEANRHDTATNFVVDAFNGKVDSALADIRTDNAGTLEQEIRDAFALVNFKGKAFRDARITDEYLSSRLTELKWAAIAQQLHVQQQEEQRRIREKMREDEKARREYEKAAKDASKEQELLHKAMESARQQVESATAEERSQYEQKLAELTEKLKKAEEKGQMAISMARQTKKGYVYIISNIGSFGDGVYKIGQTRRLEPQDRVDELGDSSVPFEFDVHAMISTDDAPSLERQMHNHFEIDRINKVNTRKEFFRIDLETLKADVIKLGFETKWTMASEAAQYRESLAIGKWLQEDPVFKKNWLQKQNHVAHAPDDQAANESEEATE